MIERGKRATALVEIRDGATLKGFGSAFCIAPSGVFVTNAHVAEAVMGARLKLVIDPGESDQSAVTAQVVRSDRAADLAVLQVDAAAAAGKYEPLTLGTDGSLYDSEEVTAFGYPFGAGLALDEKESPSVSVNVGRVTSLRKRGGALDLIQVDAALNPGNSGGPLMDAKGTVVGIVQKGLAGSGVNFAIPVSHLAKLLADPIVTLTPGSVDYQARSKSQVFRLSVLAVPKPVAADAFELALHVPGQPARTVTGPIRNGAGSAELTPVPHAGTHSPVTVTARFDAGSVTGQAADTPVVVAGQRRKLSDLTEVDRGRTADGGDAVQGLEAIDVDLGTQSARLNLAKAREVRFGPAGPDGPAVSSVPYTLTLRSGGNVAAVTEGAIAIDNAPGGGDAVATDATAPLPAAVPRRRTRPNDTFGRSADSDPRVTMTDVITARGGGPFSSYDAGYRPMIGLSYQLGEWMRTGCVKQVDPIYTRADADATGGHVQTVVARDGYAVGGLLVERDDTNVLAVAVVFMACRDGRLVPSDRYTSPWLGYHAGGRHGQVGCDGRTVVGICGRKGLNLAGIGLVELNADPQP